MQIKAYKTIIFAIVLYKHEMYLRMREELKLRLFKNGILKIFGPKDEKVAGGGRKVHYE
jgi:hypothetical protein